MQFSASRSHRAVANWVLIGVVMLMVQVILGGITRLTGSGLSITEWNVVTKTFPPLNNEQWAVEFEKYKSTPQFQLINYDFTLPDFKFIFFWEWLHRFWAKLIAIVFIVGFIYLAFKKYPKKEFIIPLLIMFLLGAMQAAIGWIMVLSGLTGDAVYVKPTKLALHFVFALGLIAYAFWFVLRLKIPPQKMIVFPALKNFTLILTTLLFIQLLFGALMAGHKAAPAAPTWPDINGSLIPVSLLREKPVFLNFIDNKITIHFVHRTLAYFVLVVVIGWTIKAYKHERGNEIYGSIRPLPLFFTLCQVILGIFTVLSSKRIVPNNWGLFEWVAQFHQIIGMLLLLSVVAALYVVRNKSSNPL